MLVNEEIIVNILTWCFWFFIYAFLGWCFESTYCSIKERRLINRGFLKMPILPIYGFGAMLFLTSTAHITITFNNIPNAICNILLTFIICSIVATVFEFIVGALMEALFKVKYWDYSHTKFNFMGYICLGSSITWGVFGVLMKIFVHPFVEYSLDNLFPIEVYGRFTCIMIGATIFDFIVSTKAAFDLRFTLEYLAKAYGKAEDMLANLKVGINDTKEDVDRRLFEFKQSLGEGIQDILKRNPTLSCAEYMGALSKVRDMLVRRAKMILDARAAFREKI